jgi:hypothetical protein
MNSLWLEGSFGVRGGEEGGQRREKEGLGEGGEAQLNFWS